MTKNYAPPKRQIQRPSPPKDSIPIDGFGKALEALQSLPPEHREKLLAKMAEANPEMAKKLAEGNIRFSLIQGISKMDFKLLFWEIERKKWIMALRGASEEMMKAFELNLTKRAYDELKQDILSLGPQPRSRVQEAQNDIEHVMVELKRAGKVSLDVQNKKDKLV